MKTPTIALLGATLTIIAATVPAASQAANEISSKGSAKETVQVQTALSESGGAVKETNLGNLIADAVRQTGHAQIGLVPADEINSRAQIATGKTDPNAIIATLHYADDPSDTVVVLNLTGAQLLKVAERSISRAPEPFDGFLQVSGLQIRYRPGQIEETHVSLAGEGSDLDAGKTYRVAMTRPISSGSLGYFQIWTQRDIAEDTGIPLAKSLGSYLSSHKTLNSVVEGRVATR